MSSAPAAPMTTLEKRGVKDGVRSDGAFERAKPGDGGGGAPGAGDGRGAGGPVRQQRQRGRGRRELGAAGLLPAGAVGGGRRVLQLSHQVGRAGRAGSRILGHPARDKRAQRLRDVLHWDDGVLVLCGQPGQWPGERRPAGEALEEHRSRRVDVGRRRGGGAVPLLGRHVQRGAARGGLPGPGGDAEVGQLADSLAVDQDALRLVVAVHDAQCVRGGQAQQRSLQCGQRRLRAGRSSRGDHVMQRDAVDQLHDDRGALSRRLDVVEDPYHLRDVQRPQQRGLGPEGRHEAGAASSRGDRYLTATRVPLARWTATITRPDAPAPSSRSSANPGTTHELIRTGACPGQRDTKPQEPASQHRVPLRDTRSCAKSASLQKARCELVP
jgi:hypothetical protein